MAKYIPKKSIIDMNQWDRNEIYYIFKDFDIPYTNLCTDVDITSFMKFIRQNEYHFFAALVFYMVKAGNVIKEFRCRLEGDVPVIFGEVGANYTLMQDCGVMGNNYTDFVNDFQTFYEEMLADLETAKKSGHMINKDLPGNAVLTITSIPWTRLSNFSQAMYRAADAVPYLGIGRRYGQNDRIKLPLAVQAHHAFVDGFHIAQYFTLLEIMLESPEFYMDDTIPFEKLLDKSRPFILSEKDKPINAY